MPHVLVNGECVTCRPAVARHQLVDGVCTCGCEPLDEDSAALLAALQELDVARSFDPSKHLRNPKGSPGGGRFRSTVDKLKDAIAAHKAGGAGHPFDGFSREQLRKVAVARKIPLKRGEDRDSIAKKLLGHLGADVEPAKVEEKKPSAEAPTVKKAAEKAAPKPEAGPDKPGAKLEKSISSGEKSNKILSQSATGTVRLVTFKDGSKAIRKTVHTKGEDGKRQVDAAQLSASIAESIGIPTPAVRRKSDHEFYMDYLDGPTAYNDSRMTDANIKILGDSEAGHALGLFDLLIDYDDRSNRDNWAYHNRQVVALDHDTAWDSARDPAKPPQEKFALSPFTGYWVDGKQWRANSLNPQSTAAIRDRLEKLRPEFEEQGRDAWLDFALKRLDAIAAHSTQKAPAPARPKDRVSGRDISGSVDYKALPATYNPKTGENDALKAVIAKQGFDGSARVVSAADFDAEVKSGTVRETWRGLAGSVRAGKPADLAEQYRTGDFHVGHGINGDGTYVALNKIDGQHYGSTLLRIGLHKDAKVISADALDAEMDKYFAANAGRQSAEMRALDAKLVKDLAAAKTARARANIRRKYRNEIDGLDPNRSIALQRDPGVFAALRGYDAIEIPKERSPDKHHEMIILNRTATIVQEA